MLRKSIKCCRDQEKKLPNNSDFSSSRILEVRFLEQILEVAKITHVFLVWKLNSETISEKHFGMYRDL